MSTSPCVNGVNDDQVTAAASNQSDSVGCHKKSLKRALSLTNISVPDLSSKKPRGRKPKIQKENIITNDGAPSTTASFVKQLTDSSTQTSDVVSECLQDEIRSLREVVTALSAKVNDLVSHLLPVNFSVPKQPIAGSEPQPISYAAVVADSDCINQPMSSHSNHDLCRPSAKPRNQSSQDAVTAMYVDLRRKQQRSNNIVITGLQYSDNDAVFVTELLEEEFGCDTEMWPGVSVAKCQRLGKQQDNKLQPLLVTLDSRDQAEYYVRNARYLRSSNNQEVKNNVYINADLTPSEAKAAFELRMERKDKQSRQQNGQVPLNQNQSKPARTYYRSKSTRDTNDARSDKRASQNLQQISLKWRPTANAQLIQSCPSTATFSVGQASPPRQATESATSIVNVDSSTSLPPSSSSSSSSPAPASSSVATIQLPVGRPENAQ